MLELTNRLQTSAVLTAELAIASSLWYMEMAVRLAHSLFGSGGGGLTPAVILHGLFGSGKNWRAIASKLASETNRLVQFVFNKSFNLSDTGSSAVDLLCLCKVNVIVLNRRLN